MAASALLSPLTPMSRSELRTIDGNDPRAKGKASLTGKGMGGARPLPSVPEPRHSSPFMSTISTNTTTTSTTHPRALSNFMPRPSAAPSPPRLLALLNSPSILASLLPFLPWTDAAHPLFNSCRTLRNDLLSDPALRDVVLRRFVPAYAHALNARESRVYNDDGLDVNVQLRDLDLLVHSLTYPLHHYPTHALRTLSSLFPTFEDDARTERLTALALAHTRFVLLMQAMVHSSNGAMPREPRGVDVDGDLGDADGYRMEIGNRTRAGAGAGAGSRRKAPPAGARFLPHHHPHHPHPRQPHALRELVFPAPLAYTQAQPQSSPSPQHIQGPQGTLSSSSFRASSKANYASTRHAHRHSKSLSSAAPPHTLARNTGKHKHLLGEFEANLQSHDEGTLRLKITRPSGPPGDRNRLSKMNSASFITPTSSPTMMMTSVSSSSSSSHSSSSYNQKSRPFSLFGSMRLSGKRKPPPPPPEEPKTLRMYGSTWRRSQYWTQGHGQSRSADFTHGYHHTEEALDEADEFGSRLDPDSELEQPSRRRFDASWSDASSASPSASAPPSIAGRDSPLSSASGSSPSTVSPVSTAASTTTSVSTSTTSAGSRRSPSYSTLKPHSHGHPQGQGQGIHDLTRAVHRTRAPILRVFVPCSVLGDSSIVQGLAEGEQGEENVLKCEQQLEDAGLWPYLSTGDIVCNLGYVPSQEQAQAQGQGQGQIDTKWLLFNGHFLVPYSPPDLLPVADPLSLPSPFYYAHITPLRLDGVGAAGFGSGSGSGSGSGRNDRTGPNLDLDFFNLSIRSSKYTHTSSLARSSFTSTTVADHSPSASGFMQPTGNPTFSIARMPRIRAFASVAGRGGGRGGVGDYNQPEMRLIKTTSRVRSPHSPRGYALVRRFAWIVRGWVGAEGEGEDTSALASPIANLNANANANAAPPLVVGKGWQGEWVLEYEGTKEGRTVLLDIVAGKQIAAAGGRIWELVREKSGAGRVWMRLLPL